MVMTFCCCKKAIDTLNLDTSRLISVVPVGEWQHDKFFQIASLKRLSNEYKNNEEQNPRVLPDKDKFREDTDGKRLYNHLEKKSYTEEDWICGGPFTRYSEEFRYGVFVSMTALFKPLCFSDHRRLTNP